MAGDSLVYGALLHIKNAAYHYHAASDVQMIVKVDGLLLEVKRFDKSGNVLCAKRIIPWIEMERMTTNLIVTTIDDMRSLLSAQMV